MILVVFGTRPEWLKIKPLIEEMNKNKVAYDLVRVRQHDDLLTITDPELPSFYQCVPISKIEGADRLSNLGSEILIKMSQLLGEYKNKYSDEYINVLVQGDTATAYYTALAAYQRECFVIHLEAGLRTFDMTNPYPEEFYRQCISKLASYHLCPTEDNMINLAYQTCDGDKIVCGNTILDVLRKYENPVTFGNSVVVTLHRRENQPIMNEWFETIDEIAEMYSGLEFKFYAHPAPAVQNNLHLFRNVKIKNPISHEEMAKEIASCMFVITDSGGLQEESSYYGKRCFVCRETTERKESVGTTSYMAHSPENLLECSDLMYRICNDEQFREKKFECPYGDGYASERIVEWFKKKRIS